jgi:hypothetical protein
MNKRLKTLSIFFISLLTGWFASDYISKSKISAIEPQKQESDEEKDVKKYYQKLVNSEFTDPIEGVIELEKLVAKLGGSPFLKDSSCWFPIKKDSIVLTPCPSQEASSYNFVIANQVSDYGEKGKVDSSKCQTRCSKYRRAQVDKLNGIFKEEKSILSNIENEMYGYIYIKNENLPASLRLNYYLCNMAGDRRKSHVFNIPKKYELVFYDLIKIIEKQIDDNIIGVTDSKIEAERKAKNIIRLFIQKKIDTENTDYPYLTLFGKGAHIQEIIQSFILADNCFVNKEYEASIPQKEILNRLYNKVIKNGQNASEIIK